MTLDELKRAITQLEPEDLEELQDYIAHVMPPLLTPEERVAMLERGISAIRDSLTPEELDKLVEDISAEYIEPWDEEEWKF